MTGVPGNGNVTLSWSAPTSTGGSPVTSYTVTASPGGASTTTIGPITTATVPSLTNGTTYTFTVTATNAVGTGSASTASASLAPAVGNTLTNYYDNSSDSPAWSGSSDGTWTRNVAGLDGNTDASVGYDPVTGLTMTTLQLMDLHGDVAATANPTGTGLSAAYTYDEFGNPTTTNALRYGWLGGKDRAWAGVGNLILMGERLYDPASGRFLQTDPVPGGSCNPYDYACQDPVNHDDLGGTQTINVGDNPELPGVGSEPLEVEYGNERVPRGQVENERGGLPETEQRDSTGATTSYNDDVYTKIGNEGTKSAPSKSLKGITEKVDPARSQPMTARAIQPDNTVPAPERPLTNIGEPYQTPKGPASGFLTGLINVLRLFGLGGW